MGNRPSLLNSLRHFSVKHLFLFFSCLLCSLLLLTGCESNMVIVSDVDEREANEIVVFLASKGISAQKITAVSAAPAAAAEGIKFNISVESGKSTEAMAVLNQNGLPRK